MQLFFVISSASFLKGSGFFELLIHVGRTCTLHTEEPQKEVD